jgi:large repetitive protein
MSETAPEAPPAPKKKPARGSGLTKKAGPLPVWGWGALAALAAGGYLWWRSRQSKSSATSSAATTSTSSATDAALETELQQLLAEQSGSGYYTSTTGTGTGSGGGSGSGGGTTTKTTAPATTKTGTTSKTTATTPIKTGAPTPVTGGGPAGAKKPARAPGQTADSPRYDSATLSWGPVAGATSYRVVALHGSDKIHDASTSAHSMNLNGLKKKTSYRWRVAAVNAAGEGPFSADRVFRTS